MPSLISNSDSLASPTVTSRQSNPPSALLTATRSLPSSWITDETGTSERVVPLCQKDLDFRRHARPKLGRGFIDSDVRRVDLDVRVEKAGRVGQGGDVDDLARNVSPGNASTLIIAFWPTCSRSTIDSGILAFTCIGPLDVIDPEDDLPLADRGAFLDLGWIAERRDGSLA